MKKLPALSLLAGVALLFVGCDSNEEVSAPTLVDIDFPATVHFGDSTSFAVKANSDAPLQNVTVAVLYGNTSVASSTVRTADADGVFRGVLAVPYIANVPDGDFQIMVLAMNNVSQHVETTTTVGASHVDYPYLTFVANNGESYRFDRIQAYEYGLTSDFPGQLTGYFKSPKPTDEQYAAGQRTVTWGQNGSSITTASVGNISLVNSDEEIVKNITLKFNTLTFAPDVPMLPSTFKLDRDSKAVTKNVTKGQAIYFEGLPANCMIDPDFLEADGDHYKFRAESGSYKITREDQYNYIRVERMNGTDYAKFEENGAQEAIWCIGNGEFGKPTKDNRVDWDTSKGLCMAKIDDHKYQLTVKLYLGLSIKFFWQKGWGGEFGGTDYAEVNSAWFGVNGSGNFEQMVDGQIVATQYTNDNKYYRITLDTSAGVHAVKLTCEEVDW